MYRPAAFAGGSDVAMTEAVTTEREEVRNWLHARAAARVH